MTGVATDVLMARHEAEAVMLDRAVVRRQSGTTWDDTLGRDVPAFGTVIYDDPDTPGAGGICAVRDGSTIRVGRTGIAIEGLVFSVPVSAVAFKIGDQVEMVASELDPTLVGVKFTITELAKGSRLTARRMQIAEV